jgi:hypothetical protein
VFVGAPFSRIAGPNIVSDEEDVLKAALTSSKLQKKKLRKDPFEYMGELLTLLFISTSG